MDISINPFQQLFFSDDVEEREVFVPLFSAEVLQAAIHPVFRRGHFVLSGSQGCGKSMILNLLKPEIRIAYAEADEAFPVPSEFRRFISAGINLTKSGIVDLLHVTLGNLETDELDLPFFFADFFNYWVVADLLQSIKTVGSKPDIFDKMVNPTKENAFVKLIVKQDCWFGELQGIETFSELEQRIHSRIGSYRRWINNARRFNLDANILDSRTNIGEPIARTADCMRESGLIAKDVLVFVRVDQVEELHRSRSARQESLFSSFRKILNRPIAMRDARVHYKFGSRPYGWNSDEYLQVWGTEAKLEFKRDYYLADMDKELFVAGESTSPIFKRFAMDAFHKRVAYYYHIDRQKLSPNIASRVFGNRRKPADRVEQLNADVSDKQIDRALAFDRAKDGEDWPSDWKTFLRELYRSGPEGMIDAILASAWARQTGGGQYKLNRRDSGPPDDSPWKNRKWWRKERLNQAVLQLTTRNQQRYLWWGFRDICSLSGGNIVVFLHICHRIWDGFLKQQSSLPESRRIDPLFGGPINRNVQAAGILFASDEWFKKLPEEPDGNTRQAFISALGVRLNNAMLDDLAMSYPGGNGFTLPPRLFDSGSAEVVRLQRFLEDAVGFGALVETERSSKDKRQGLRKKYYMPPILCPRFQLPEARTKEPYYWSIEDLWKVLFDAKVTLKSTESSMVQSKIKLPRLPGFE